MKLLGALVLSLLKWTGTKRMCDKRSCEIHWYLALLAQWPLCLSVHKWVKEESCGKKLLTLIRQLKIKGKSHSKCFAECYTVGKITQPPLSWEIARSLPIGQTMSNGMFSRSWGTLDWSIIPFILFLCHSLVLIVVTWHWCDWAREKIDFKWLQG